MKLLTVEQAALKLGRTPQWVYSQTRARCENKIPFRKMGKYLMFIEEEIDAWILNACPGHRLKGDVQSSVLQSSS